MPIDYSVTDKVVELTFGKLNRSTAKMDFPEPGTLSNYFNRLVNSAGTTSFTLPHQNCPMLASAGVEMWHRAIHSFLWSIALTEKSPLWASVAGYYSSHFVMRAYAHSMGIFKSFIARKAIQVVILNGQLLCNQVESSLGEHAFYWKVVKEHPKMLSNPLFRENYERNPTSDSAHRTFANYTDHIDSFAPIGFPTLDSVIEDVEKISRIRLNSVIEPSREDFPDLQNVQILAFHRIVAFHDFLEERLSENRFWRAHRRPTWCRGVMIFQVDDQNLEQPLVA